jgi:N-acetylmuramoyl-L-alanine amidase
MLWLTRRLWLLAVCGLVLATAAPASLVRSDFISLRGRMYVDAGKWAERQKLVPRWNSGAGELRLTNRWARLGFKADTARVEFDGTLVWLSAPMTKLAGQPLLPVRDVDHILGPLLNPPRLTGADKVKVIALSAGHGGKDPGNIEGNRKEKDYTLKLALEVERQLKRAGFEVVQVRDRDRYLAPEERPNIANRRKADLYLALHYNGRPTAHGSAQGLETYCLTRANGESTNGGQSRGYMPGNRRDRENLTLAYQLHRSLLGAFNFADRGVRHANFAELRLAEMPAVLIEGGFMDSREDALRIYSDQARGKFATAVVDGVLAYKRLVERGQPE